MDMIERVARVMEPCVFDGQGAAFEMMQGRAMAQARAVIESLREPTEGMINAGIDGDDEGGHFNCRAAWQAMIDAALVGEE